MAESATRRPTANSDRSQWPFQVQTLHGTLGAEILGLDLAKPVDDALFSCIYGAFLAHQLLLFRDQDLRPGA